MGYSRLAVALMVAGMVAIPLGLAGQPAGESGAPDWPFFAFDNGVGRDQGWRPGRQAEFLRQLGYAGIGYSGVRELHERLTAAAERGLRVFSFYEPFYSDAETPVSPKTVSHLSVLGDHDAILWLHVHGNASDDRLIADFRELADQAAPHGARVAIYPHANLRVETGAEALKLVKSVDRDNFGMSINLCHELRAGMGDGLDQLVRDSADRLFLVSIHGADRVQTPESEHGWSRLIRPLGEGDFDLAPLLRDLQAVGYRGPVGLQCYRAPGYPDESLRASRVAWKALLSELAAEP